MLKFLYIVSSVFILCASICPIIESNHWFIRGFDFPRVQIVVFVIVFMIISVRCLGRRKLVPVILFCLLSLGFDAYRIGGYTKLVEVESKKSEIKDSTLSVISLNVQKDNNKYNRVIDFINEEKPDVFLALEPDRRWLKALNVLNKDYPYRELVPKDNSYGMLLYSKYKLLNTKVMHLVDKNIPSIFTEVEILNGKFVSLICLHPRPPRPNGASSLQRDGELIAAAKIIKQLKDRAVMVVGDLNDVAWSHTTRLFKRLSGTLDPRIGRGFFNTFPASLKLLSFPLDHIFHNENLSLVEMKVMKNVGSDHLPVLARFNVDKNFANNLNRADSGDLKEARRISDKADHWKSSDIKSE